jgi:hypothetical protein
MEVLEEEEFNLQQILLVEHKMVQVFSILFLGVS